eukprot:4285902-Alexandrium_andersonii.AAC.1
MLFAAACACPGTSGSRPSTAWRAPSAMCPTCVLEGLAARFAQARLAESVSAVATGGGVRERRTLSVYVLYAPVCASVRFGPRDPRDTPCALGL